MNIKIGERNIYHQRHHIRRISQIQQNSGIIYYSKISNVVSYWNTTPNQFRKIAEDRKKNTKEDPWSKNNRGSVQTEF